MTNVPPALRTWFVIHFWADMAFALPLFFAPHAFLTLFGWPHVDPATARLVAAALFGIGIESLLGRDGTTPSFRTMLRLKVIWSSTATIGLVWTALDGGPPAVWLFAAIFGAFCGVWSWWRRRLA